MTNLRIFLILSGIFFMNGLWAQESEKKFQVEGNPVLKVFANYHSNFDTDEASDIIDEGMELRRAYLGYKAKLSEHFSAKLVMDVSNQTGKYDTYLKNAELGYKKGRWAFNVGLISTTQFKVQEKFWAYRYLRKSFQDQYKYNSSADLGLSVSYKIHDILSVDAIIQNGEGYKNIDPTNTYRTGLGTTLKLDPLVIRLYYDISHKTAFDRQNFTTFIGYRYQKVFRLGAEFNYQLHNQFIADHNMYGFSVYSTYVINSKFEVLARYDNSMSNVITGSGARPGITPQAWNVNRDEQVAIAGLQFRPISRVKIGANYRRSLSAIADSKWVDWLFLNLEFKL